MEGKELDIRNYLRVISKRKYTVYAFFSIVFTVVLVGTLSSTPVFLANTKVLVEKSEPSSPLLMNYYYQPYDPEFYQTQYQLIKGASVARRVVRKLSLEKNYGSYIREDRRGFSPVGATVRLFKELLTKVFPPSKKEPPKANKETAPVQSENEAIEALARNISSGIMVAPVKDSRIVNVSYTSSNPELAMLIANTVATAYIEELLEMRMSSSRYAIEWMTKKVEEEKSKLEDSEKALQEYMRANDIVTLEDRVAIVPQKLSELGTQLLSAEAERKGHESVYGKIKEMKGNLDSMETLSAVSSDPTVQSLRAQILKAEQNIWELQQKYGMKHPAMIRAMEDLNVLKKKRQEEIGRVVASIRNQYDLAKTKEANLRNLLSETKGDALDLNEKFIQYGVLTREVETNRQLYDALIKRIKEQSVTEEIQPVKVWIIEKAQKPKRPIKPKKTLNIIFGIAAGLMGGIGLAFFVEYLDNTIKSPEEAESKLGLPVLGMISFMKDKEKIEDIVKKEPQSPFAESYKHIRTSILLSSPSMPPKNILVTSMAPEEGKTVTSVNLALTIAQSDYSVLLVDGDLRKPRIHKIFGLENSVGLSTCLAGASEVVIKDSGIKNLSILPSGPIPPNPSELIGSVKMRETMAILNERFDFIIWDSPPMLTVAETLILNRVVDGTLIVAWAGKTTYDTIRRGMKSLKDIGAHTIGLVINALDVRKSDYYYKYYRNYYTYGEDKKK